MGVGDGEYCDYEVGWSLYITESELHSIVSFRLMTRRIRRDTGGFRGPFPSSCTKVHEAAARLR